MNKSVTNQPATRNPQPATRNSQPATTNHSIRTMSLTFDLPIYPRQIRNWRGAFLEMAGWGEDLLHNHTPNGGYVIRYPMIQYRIQRGKASIIGFNEGVDVLQRVLATSNWKINWQGNERQLNVIDLRMNEHFLRMTKTPKSYRLYKYIALNGDNYRRFKAAHNMQARTDILQEVLTGQLLGFATAMGWQMPPGQLQVEIQNIQLTKKTKLHDTERIAFNLDYSANLLLPAYISLGKGKSFGFGWQKKLNVKNPFDLAREEMNRETEETTTD